jgi:hypothetical protein
MKYRFLIYSRGHQVTINVNSEPKFIDPVIDPNETWSHFIRRVSQFDPPPLVERSSLP